MISQLKTFGNKKANKTPHIHHIKTINKKFMNQLYFLSLMRNMNYDKQEEFVLHQELLTRYLTTPVHSKYIY